MFDRVASTKGGTPIEHYVVPAKEPIVRTFRVSSQILCEKAARVLLDLGLVGRSAPTSSCHPF